MSTDVYARSSRVQVRTLEKYRQRSFQGVGIVAFAQKCPRFEARFVTGHFVRHILAAELSSREAFCCNAGLDLCGFVCLGAFSEFAGCALSFKGALLVNPYDPDKVAESIHTALAMPVRN